MIHSPNTVIAKYLEDTIDLIRPRIETNKPKEILFYVGVNINGAPHIGTYLVQTFAFLMAEKLKEKYKLPIKILFGVHDNISFDSKEDENKVVFHRTYNHALGAQKIRALIKDYYVPYFEILNSKTGIPYDIETYSDKQSSKEFRKYFLSTLKHAEDIRWAVSPSKGFLQVRVPCPKCEYSERDAQHTKLKDLNVKGAIFQCHCINHGTYEVLITPENETYIDLNTLYRNLVKEFYLSKKKDTLSVVIKGGDWVYSTQTIDWGLAELGCTALNAPARIFLPQIVALTGAKLSKTLISEKHESVKGVPEWMIDMRKFRNSDANYAEKLISLSELMLTDPRHVFRSYSYTEIMRLIEDL